jgi:hypothetical protein
VILWQLRPSNSARLQAVLLGDAFDESLKHGIDPRALRAMPAMRANPPMQLMDMMGRAVACASSEAPDVLFFGWVPVFSERARDLGIKLGNSDDDFMPCTLERVDARFYMHLPALSYDIVDIPKSTFAGWIPGTPPLPVGMQAAHLLPNIPTLPPYFRAPIPGDPQVLGELFVTDDLMKEWKRAKFRGGGFRRLA